MTPTMQSLGLDRLSVPDRLRLVEELWDSIPAQELPIPESHKEELDRRLAAADADPNGGSPWEAVKVRLWNKPRRWQSRA